MMAKTSDKRKTKAQLIEELAETRAREEALRESEETFRALADNANDGIMIAEGRGGAHVYANRRMAEITGYSVPELLKTTMADLVHPDQLEEVRERFQRRLEGKRAPRQHEIVFVRKDGKSVPLEMTSAKTVWRGQPAAMVAFRDITDRKRAEAEHERLLTAREHRSTQLQTAAEVSRATSSILEPDELIQQVVNLVRERFDLYYAGLFLVDQTGEWTRDLTGRVEPGKWAVLRAGTGEAGQEMVEQGHRLEVGGESMIGWCVANRQARVALDVGEEAVRFENPLLPETRSELALPLVSRGQVIGALTIQSAQEAAFSVEDIAVLQTMADQLANAIANARLYAALAREQYLMNALMNNVPDYIYFKDRESRFIRTTEAHAKTFGLSDPAEAIGKTDFDFFSDEHARQAYEDEQRIVRTGEPILGIEERETWPDRPDTWVLTSKMPLRDEEGNIVGTFGISSDITPRKQAELALERRAVQLQAAAEVAREAAAILDVRQLLDVTVQLISDRFGFYHAGIFLVDEPGEYVILQAASSKGGQRMLERGYKLAVGKTGIVGYVAVAGEPRIALDVGEDVVFFDNPDLPSTRSEMALPLMVRGRVIGVLDVQSTAPNAFTEEDATVLQTTAGQLATAIDNARLVERTEAQLRELSRLYGEYSAAAWTEMSALEHPLGYVYDRIGVLPVEGSPAPALDMALERGETVALADPVTQGAVLAVPLKLRGQVIGTLGVQDTGNTRKWSPEEIALIEALSDQIAAALDSARLFGEARIRAEELAVLNELARALAASLTVNEVLEEAYRGASRLLHTANFYVGLYDPEKNEINFAFEVSESEEDRQVATIPADQGLTGYIVHNRESLLIRENLPERLKEMGVESIGGNALSWLGVPLLIGDQVMGVMAVQDYTTPRAYDEHDRDMLMAVASQTAIAIQNTRLLQQTQLRAQRERQVYEITAKLRRSPDIETILQTAVDELGEALRVDRALIRLAVKPREEQANA